MAEQFRLYDKPIGRKAETTKHFLIKCMIFKLLVNADHKAKIERNIGNGVIDVFDFTTGMCYEVETRKNPEYNKRKLEEYLKHTGIKDIIFIYLEDIRQFDVRVWEAYVKQRLEV